MKDTFNLRDIAKFEISIGKNIAWVPYNILGKTKWSNDEMKEINQLKEDEIRECITVPYEVAQFIQVNQYKKNIDIKIITIGDKKWELHRDGKLVLRKKEGCCSTYAGLFYYLLGEKFYEVYILCIVANDGWGHAISYIKIDGNFYFFDISAQISEYISFVAKETGKKSDFVKRKIFTGCCLKAKSISDFITFFMRFQKIKQNKREYIFFSVESTCVPPISISKNGTITNIHMRCKDIFLVHDDIVNSSFLLNLF